MLSDIKPYNKGMVELSVTAAAKIDRLILSLPSEVGFYGLVERVVEGEKTIFKITDILIYPQIVSSSTVLTDDLEMTNFYIANAGNIRKIRYHGHSHADFSASPSMVDLYHSSELIVQLKQDDFYIFQIFNKFDELSSFIYIEGRWWEISCRREVDAFINYNAIHVSG